MVGSRNPGRRRTSLEPSDAGETAGGPPAAQLIVIRGSDGPSVIDLGPKELTIGRGEDNDLTLESSKVSRSHARMTVQGTLCCLEDLSSVNGTYLNGRKLHANKPVALRNKDVFRISHFLFLFLLHNSVEQRSTFTSIILDPDKIAEDVDEALAEFELFVKKDTA